MAKKVDATKEVMGVLNSDGFNAAVAKWRELTGGSFREGLVAVSAMKKGNAPAEPKETKKVATSKEVDEPKVEKKAAKKVVEEVVPDKSEIKVTLPKNAKSAKIVKGKYGKPTVEVVVTDDETEKPKASKKVAKASKKAVESIDYVKTAQDNFLNAKRQMKVALTALIEKSELCLGQIDEDSLNSIAGSYNGFTVLAAEVDKRANDIRNIGNLVTATLALSE